ncbi:MAG: class I SAM-dependent methyltransferase [Bacteroidia bacterium]
MSLERQEHNKNTPLWGEHIHRYNVALQYINSNSKIVDIACGNGFGSYMLSQNTNELVFGGDISSETIDYCSKQYTSEKNLQFKIIDGTNMPFEDNHFDCITSFETIEHTSKYKEMIQEFYRTLKNGGVAILSTPNRIVSSPTGIVLNPFHTQEFTYEELLLILKEIFDEVTIYGQKYIRYQTKSFRNMMAQLVENTLYLRGFRKIPLSLQNSLMNLLIKKTMYPLPEDFDLTNDKEEILKCKTFFALCLKK